MPKFGHPPFAIWWWGEGVRDESLSLCSDPALPLVATPPDAFTMDVVEEEDSRAVAVVRVEDSRGGVDAGGPAPGGPAPG